MLNSKLLVPGTRSSLDSLSVLMGDSLVHGKQPLELRGEGNYSVSERLWLPQRHVFVVCR